ncbi:kinase [Kitasatospora sp. NPDC056076]|uniref:GHMP family kinase ATP-binding protein n=1 Tax=Kitasatospora sp. NPDC056076 TaxID=3345703 RepID=UPI0035DF09EF
MTSPTELPAATALREGPGRGTGTGRSAGTGRAFGTFGELLQGALPDDGPEFLVTLPIAGWSTATFRYDPQEPAVSVRPAHKAKSRRLAGLLLELTGRPGGGELDLTGELPEGKGLASSSADLVATARAVAAALRTPLPPTAVEALLRRIEPTDGVMYDGIVSFLHRDVRLRERLGFLPSMTVLAHDEGGRVDTVGFNRIPKDYTDEERREYGRLLTALGTAVRTGDLAEVGRIATRSTELSLRRRPHRGSGELRALCAELDGLGLVRAHSGTNLGVLLPAGDPELAAKVEHARAACRSVGGTVSVHRTLGPEEFAAAPELTAVPEFTAVPAAPGAGEGQPHAR